MEAGCSLVAPGVESQSDNCISQRTIYSVKRAMEELPGI